VKKFLKCSLFFGFVLLLAGFSSSGINPNGGVLNPKGIIASQERRLLIDSVLFMLIVVVPVIILSFAFAWKYRRKNKKSMYAPGWSHSVLLESIWWAVPCLIIIILSILAWKSSHKLDPYRTIPGKGKSMVIQAVSLQWKWLFIYPKENIATVNYIEIPKDREVEFQITSDAPMNAFFIPQLGSQIYSMAGMRTRLHIIGNSYGMYKGFSANYSGDGFSDMNFKVKVTSDKGFKNWVNKVKQSKSKLYIPEYKILVKPSEDNPASYYSSVKPKLFNRIRMQYTMPNMRLH
jgi:cytochrome o ubiquinol oxidase subunit II